MKSLMSFWMNERGAVPSDWVALTAGVLLLALTLTYGLYSKGVGELSDTINATLVDAGSVADGASSSSSAFQ